jgi:hypothetical protein
VRTSCAFAKTRSKGSNVRTQDEIQRINPLSPELQKSFQQIKELAAIREAYIRNKGLSLSLKHLCNKLGIYPTTVKLLAPDLYRNWNDLDFRWDGPHQ